MKHVGKNIAIGSGGFVYEADLRAIKDFIRIRARVIGNPIEGGSKQLTMKALNQHL